MDHDTVDLLEHECERAIADALRRHHPQPVEPQVCHLMAKAAIAVLEAAERASPPPSPPPRGR